MLLLAMPKLFRVISIFTFAVVGAYFAGDFSMLIGYRLAAMGIHIPLRELINALIAVVLFLIYAKTQNSLHVKWGGFGGFSAGLETIIMILSVAWGALVYSKAIGNITILKGFSVPMLLSALVFMLLHAVAEQILLQEVLQKRAKEIIGEKAGIVIAAAGFATLQAMQGYLHPLYIFNSLCLGVLMAVLYEKHGFMSVVAFHAFWSYLEIVVKNSVFTMDYHYNYLLWRGQDSYGSPLFGAFCLVAGVMIFGLKKNNLGEEENIL